jgi:hypothetical protein
MTDTTGNPYLHPAESAPLSPAQEKQYALLTHLLSIFFGFIAALIFFVLFRGRGPFVRAHTVTEWNFQLTILIVEAAAFVLAFASVLGSFAAASGQAGPPPGIGLFFVGYFLIIAVRIVATIFGIIASVAANRGRFYRYPIAIPFVRV